MAIAASLLLVSGCASIGADESLSEVQTTAAQRLGDLQVQLNPGDASDAVAAAVATLLERPLTAEAAVQIALINNRRLQADYAALGIARADLVQASLLANPSFSAEILVGNGSVSPAFSLVQNIFSLVTLPTRRTVASSALESAKLELGARILETAAATRRAYYTALADQQAAGLLRQVTSASEAAAELSERQTRAGNLSRRDQSVQQAQYAQAVFQLARAEARLASDRERLNRLLGLFGDQVTWNLPDRLPEIPAAKPQLDGLETVAIQHRLDLAGARQDLQTASYSLDIGRQLRLLSVLGLGIDVERDPDSKKWLTGPRVNVTLPIFDQGQGRIAGLEAQRRRTDRTFAALAIEVRSEVRETYARLIATHDSAAFYRTKVIPLQQQILAENQRLYNGMLISVYELLRSRQDQINAAREYIEALHDYWLARSDLERALAGPIPITPTASIEPANPKLALIPGDQP
ncbi:MAG: TolC family protein [Proteobacteria bacterium]|nr:TolC family protein [Pseudomonadota bacterium]